MDPQQWTPIIYAANLSKSVVVVGESVEITVYALDVFGGQQTEARYAGEIYSGEV